MKIYLVGGAVRDQILKKPIKDQDFIVFESSDSKFQQKFPLAKKIKDDPPLFIYKGDEYTISNSKDIHEDLMMRDLTINAFAKDESSNIIAHPLAYKDLTNKILRPIAIENFFKDPLRVFRAARFAACFSDFKIHPELLEAMIKVGQNNITLNISAERVGNETLKALTFKKPSIFFEILSKTNNLLPWFYELSEAIKVPAGNDKIHSSTLFDHIKDIIDKLDKTPTLVWMGLCHDIGKIKPNQDNIGSEIAKSFGIRLKLPNKIIKAGIIAAKWNKTASQYQRLDPGTKIKLLLYLNQHKLLIDFFKLIREDTGKDFIELALKDLNLILSIKLPKKYWGLGKKSGVMLNQMRVDAL